MFSIREYTGRPAALICVCFVLGAACYADISAGAALVMTAAAPMVGTFFDGEDRRRIMLSAAALGICCLAAGVLGFAGIYFRDNHDISLMHDLDGASVSGTAVIADLDGGGYLLDFIDTDRTVAGRAVIVTDGDPSSFSPGDVVGFCGKCSLYSGAANPGEFSYLNYMKSRGQYFRMDGSVSPDAAEPDFPARMRAVFYRFSYSVREWVRGRIDRLFGTASGAVKGFLTGDTSGIPNESMNMYRRAGIGHIFAVSGMHVTILANAASFLLMLLGAGSRGRRIAAGISALFLLVICGFTASSLRAARMLLIGWAAEAIRRRSDGITTISLSAAVSLALTPHLLYDTGFVMSHCILLSFTIVYGRLAAPLLSGRGRVGGPRSMGMAVFGEGEFRGGRLTKAVSAVTAPLIFWLSAMPVSAAYFGSVTRWGWLVSILCAPLFPVLIVSSLLALALGCLWMPAAQAVACVTRLALGVLDTVCGFFGTEGAAFDVSPMPIWLWAALLLLTVGVRLDGAGIIGRGGPAMAGIMGMAVAVAAAVMAVSAAARPAVQVTFLSIGQGDCSVARFADGRVMVVDAGPEASSETLLAYCRRQRISVIDALVLSHGHADHGGGMTALLREFEVKRIFMSGPEDAILAAEIEEAAGQKGVSVTRLWAGDVFEIGGARVSVVWPRPDGEALWRENRNDYSLVMSLEAGNCSFIFTGDVEYDAESLIMESACGCDVLKIPHHGSAGAGSEAWLRTLAPELAVISVGRNNYGHPSDRVLDILDGIGSRTIVTLWDGAAVITCDGSRCSVSEWKGPWGLKN